MNALEDLFIEADCPPGAVGLLVNEYGGTILEDIHDAVDFARRIAMSALCNYMAPKVYPKPRRLVDPAPLEAELIEARKVIAAAEKLIDEMLRADDDRIFTSYFEDTAEALAHYRSQGKRNCRACQKRVSK